MPSLLRTSAGTEICPSEVTLERAMAMRDITTAKTRVIRTLAVRPTNGDHPRTPGIAVVANESVAGSVGARGVRRHALVADLEESVLGVEGDSARVHRDEPVSEQRPGA